MALSTALLSHIETQLPNSSSGINILDYSPVTGGNINQVYCLQTSQTKYLLKVNGRAAFPGMFACEAEGLNAIAATKTIAVPQVITTGYHNDDSFLILEWVETTRPNAQSSTLLGWQLAQMHQKSAASFGFEADNYMGSLKQSNNRHITWANFYIHERLMPMVKTAAAKRLLTTTDQQNFEKLYSRLSGLFTEEHPSLTHGDLWGGNYLIRTDGKPYLIDPAISYAHRETDLALSTLFGGFAPEFYTAYNDAFPLIPGWQQRLDLWNLYPLLLHLNLFGAGYLGQVRDCLGRYL